MTTLITAAKETTRPVNHIYLFPILTSEFCHRYKESKLSVEVMLSS